MGEDLAINGNKLNKPSGSPNNAAHYSCAKALNLRCALASPLSTKQCAELLRLLALHKFAKA